MSHGEAGLSFSVDGTAWTREIGTQLFDRGVTMAPGDVVTDTVWIRNASAEAATVVIHDEGTSTTGPDSHAFQLQVSSGDGATSVAVSQLERCQTILQTDLQPDEVARVDVALELPRSAGEAVEDRRVKLKLGVTGTGEPQSSDGRVCEVSASDTAGREVVPALSDDLNLPLLLGLLVLAVLLATAASSLRARAQRRAEVTTSAASASP